MAGDVTAGLRNAVLASGGQQAPASPLGNFPELSKLYQSSFQLPLSNAGTQATAQQDQATIANRRAAASQAIQATQDLADPSKYRQLPKPDGGYTFLNPAGKEISAFDFSRITGQDLGSVLKQSQNPIDVGFNQDYQNLQDYLKNKVNAKNDDTARVAAEQTEQQVKTQFGFDLHSANIQEVLKKFQQAYPTVFGGSVAGVPAGQTFIQQQGALSPGGAGGKIGR